MPTLNYHTGSACMGFGAIAIDGSVPANLSGTLANYPKWLSSTEVLYHQYGNGETLEKYNVNTGVVTQVDASGANFLGAGNSVWAAWLAGSGLRTSVGAGPFPNAGLIEVSETGLIALVTNRAADSGIKVYSAAGALLQTIAVQLTNTISISCRENMVAYQDASGWHLVNATTGVAVSGFVSRANVLICIPFTFNSQVWVLELDTSTSQLSLRNVQTGGGWIVGNATGQEYWYDVRPRGLGCRIAWSTGQGEAASELVLTDVNLSTGANQVGTVSGGVLVFAPGTDFVGQSFQHINSSAFRPPLVHPPIDPNTRRFTKPWAAFFRTVGETAQSQGTAIAAIQGGSTSQPHDPLTDLLNADNLVEGTVPHARKWTETVVTDTGTEDNYAIGLADQLTCNNASSLTFTGFNAGIGGRRLVVSPANSTLILANESASSTAANRIVTGTGADLTLTVPVLLAYDTDDDRWKIVGGTGAAAAPPDAQYVVAAAHDDLSAERVATNTDTVEWDFGTAGQAKADVPDDAITLAKLQDIDTQRVIARDTSGTGDPETVAISDILDWIGTTRGSVLYRGASGWAILSPGTSGHAIVSNGAGADPTYQAVAVTDIQTLLDGISSTQGVVLYHNGTDWVALSPGTSGQFLQTQGAAANPQWATPAGGGDVTAGSNITDNAIVRGDGGAKGVQESVLTLTDGGEIAMLTADPGSPTNGHWWVVASGTSPTRTIALKCRDDGTTYTIASITV